jgi:hypothetical protein
LNRRSICVSAEWETTTALGQTHLVLVHAVAHLGEELAHLGDLDPPLVPVVKARKRLEQVVLPVEVEEALPHHREELGEVDTVGGAGSPARPRGEERVEEIRRGRLAWSQYVSERAGGGVGERETAGGCAKVAKQPPREMRVRATRVHSPSSVNMVRRSASETRPSPSWSIMLNASLNCLTCCGENMVYAAPEASRARGAWGREEGRPRPRPRAVAAGLDWCQLPTGVF